MRYWSKGSDWVGGWEGNRRSGVALAMRHGLSGLSTYGLNGHKKEMTTPPTLL